jgi:hypothetical protein
MFYDNVNVFLQLHGYVIVSDRVGRCDSAFTF